MAARGPSWVSSLLASCPGSQGAAAGVSLHLLGPLVLTHSAPKICLRRGAVGLPPWEILTWLRDQRDLGAGARRLLIPRQRRKCCRSP